MEEEIRILENLKKEKTKWENRIYGVGETRIDLMIEDVIRIIQNLINKNKTLEAEISNMYDEEVVISIISDEFNLSREEVLELLGE